MKVKNELGITIRRLREEKDWSQLDLAKLVNINNSVLSRIESGKRAVEHELLIQFAEIFNVSTDYLLKQSIQTNNHKLVTIPILGIIRAGIPLLAEGNWQGEVEVPADLEADFALFVTGDSMSWVGIYEGDLAIMRQNSTPSHGMIVAAGIDEFSWEATLKFYVEDNGHKLLRAANPDYEEIPLTAKHRIIGHTVSIQKNPPSLQDYKRFLLPKEVIDQNWQNVIEKAAGKNMDGERVERLIDLFSDMVDKA